jgi:hypothetical protein
MNEEKTVEIAVVSGASGPCVYINDYRVAGQKPWGGGKILFKFNVKATDIEKALQGS